MKRIILYQAYDGTRFETVEKCHRHEYLCDMADNITFRLPKIKETTDFTNGGGYIQHDKETFDKAKLELLVFFMKNYNFDDTAVDAYLNNQDSIDISYVNHALSNTLPSTLSRAWSRIMCTDDQYREWGQYYYTLHPDKGEQKQLN